MFIAIQFWQECTENSTILRMSNIGGVEGGGIVLPEKVSPFISRMLVAFMLASLLAYKGRKKKSLSKSGAIAAWIVGFISFTASFRFGMTLIVFYQSSSWLTKYKEGEKKKLEQGHKEGGQRDYNQVFSCSLLATLIAVAYMYKVGTEDAPIDFDSNTNTHSNNNNNSTLRSMLLCAYLGHYACCNGDTWASELGVLNTTKPKLITQFWRNDIPVGTNGAISLLGTLASILGGGIIGLTFALGDLFYLTDDYSVGIITTTTTGGSPLQVGCVYLGLAAGLGGSMIDSVLGACLQATYYDRDKKMIVSIPTAAARTKNTDIAPTPIGHPAVAPNSTATCPFAAFSNKLDVNVNMGTVEHICGYDILSNEQVNMISVALTTAACAYWGKYFF